MPRIRLAYSAELRARVKELGLADSVVFTGHRSDVRDVICACDVTVSTSIQPPESFGRAVLESVRLGRITLGYDHGGVGEVLGTVYPEGRVPLRDVETLAAKLADAATGRMAAPEPSSHFLLSTMQDRELALYNELCSQPPVSAQRAA